MNNMNYDKVKKAYFRIRAKARDNCQSNEIDVFNEYDNLITQFIEEHKPPTKEQLRDEIISELNAKNGDIRYGKWYFEDNRFVFLNKPNCKIHEQISKKHLYYLQDISLNLAGKIIKYFELLGSEVE